MWEDPIVKEVRKAGEELAKKSNYNMDILFKNLRKNEKKRRAKVVSRVGLKIKHSKKEKLIKA